MKSTLKIMIVEDDDVTRNNYIDECKRTDNISIICATDSTEVAFNSVKEETPDAIILDLELHSGCGNGISFLKKLRSSELERQPYVLVVTNNISSITHDMVRKSGADFIMTKTQKDYNAKMVLEFLSSLQDSLKTSGDNSSENENATQKRLSEKIDKELDNIGISPKMKGREYLKTAIKMTCLKKRTNISAAVAEQFSKSSASVERAIQTAINHAWRITDVESLDKYYTAYINPKKGVPTVNEFIYYYADKINKEL